MAPMLTSMAATLVLVLAAATPLDWSRAQTVIVIASEYGFAPSRLTFHGGMPYRLHLENHGKELHEFTAPAFLKSVELGNPDALNADRSEVVLQPGEQQDLFLVPRQAGRYPFVCADHDWAGMTGEIIVDSDG
jgi:uncharacterized cupredoxin-like copper-binding protein